MADTSAPPQPGRSARSLACRSFWILVALAVLAAGTLTSTIAAPPNPRTGLRVAAGGLVLAVSLALATRVMIAPERARRRDRH